MRLALSDVRTEDGMDDSTSVLAHKAHKYICTVCTTQIKMEGI